MGAQRAAEVLFTGRWMSADEAVEAGFALRRVAHSSLMGETMTFAKAVAANSADALRAIKRLILASQAPLVAAARAREDAAFAELLGSVSNTAAMSRFESTGRL
jgi:enoyl-CoA hydratase/carnithine racemase